MSLLVWLVRTLGHEGVPGSIRNYAVARRLPISPFVGMSIEALDENDEAVVEHVRVSFGGGVIVWLADRVYDTMSCPLDEWPGQLGYETRGGWFEVSDCWSPPGPGQVPPRPSELAVAAMKAFKKDYVREMKGRQAAEAGGTPREGG